MDLEFFRVANRIQWADEPLEPVVLPLYSRFNFTFSLQAIDEPNFCEAYANMCRTMSQFKVSTPAPSGQGGAVQTATVEFRKVLLTRCQREFEKDRANEDKLSDLRKKVEEAKTPVSVRKFTKSFHLMYSSRVVLFKSYKFYFSLLSQAQALLLRRCMLC